MCAIHRATDTESVRCVFPETLLGPPPNRRLRYLVGTLNKWGLEPRRGVFFSASASSGHAQPSARLHPVLLLQPLTANPERVAILVHCISVISPAREHPLQETRKPCLPCRLVVLKTARMDWVRHGPQYTCKQGEWKLVLIGPSNCGQVAPETASCKTQCLFSRGLMHI
jgi:hypothetical protein